MLTSTPVCQLPAGSESHQQDEWSMSIGTIRTTVSGVSIVSIHKIRLSKQTLQSKAISLLTRKASCSFLINLLCLNATSKAPSEVFTSLTILLRSKGCHGLTSTDDLPQLWSNHYCWYELRSSIWKEHVNDWDDSDQIWGVCFLINHMCLFQHFLCKSNHFVKMGILLPNISATTYAGWWNNKGFILIVPLSPFMSFIRPLIPGPLFALIRKNTGLSGYVHREWPS